MLRVTIQYISITFCFLFLFYSCKGQPEKTCAARYKEARDIVYSHPDDKEKQDSALRIMNDIIRCDRARTAAVDLKIRLLISLRGYPEAIKFVDSLTEDDFTFKYKKSFTAKGLQALIYKDNGDTVRQKLLYADMSAQLEQYIKRNNISEKEFNEIYTELFMIKGLYLTAEEYNKEVDRLKGQYPNKIAFFEFFKKVPSEETRYIDPENGN